VTDILHDRHRIDQGQVLMDEGNSGLGSAPRRQWRASEANLPGIRRVNARKHLDEG
jgi:hypothetical protein